MLLDILFAAVFCITMVVAPIAWVRMLTAKNQPTYVRNIALFVLPILAVFALGQAVGFVDFTAPPKTPVPPSGAAPQLTWQQIVLLSTAGCVWIVGGNVLTYRQSKRLGRSFWRSWNPFQPPFRDFNRQEWAALAGLAALAMALGVSAINLGPR
jgi:hypothetical protein